jgi:NADH:ubiquinone oxidoreductase subunit F (NADH-binding)/NADH:ubiquinone oxidoreductase subunit E
MGRRNRAAGLPVMLRPVPKGRPTEPAALAEVQAALGEAPRRRDLLIEHLHAVQDAIGYLTLDHLNALAEDMRLTPAEVYEVATFYHHFDVVADGEAPPPPLTVRVCESIACEMAGAHQLLDALRDGLGAGVRVLPAPCIGRCAGAPAALVGTRAVDGASFDDASEALDAVARLIEDGEIDAVVEDYTDYATYRDAGGYEVLRACVEGDRAYEDVHAALEASGLRGLGGAGFPSARKWTFVRAEPAPRHVALNADEGEPGTFKDRYCIETDPHRVLEGLLIAAWAVEAETVWIYLRDEYPTCREILTRELAALRADPPCALPEIHLRRGAGAYICGEETSLIESIEGKRGEPRLRPPFPAQVGVFGRPTLVHNVETVYWMPEILRRGPEWYSGEGRRGRSGMRYFSVSGRVARPGVYLAPAGVSARELIDEYAGGMAEGHTFYAFLPGGASGGILPASLGDEPLDFDVLAEHGSFIGSAAIVILSEADSAAAAALNLVRFFRHESCGKCTPCRVGTAKAAGLMDAAPADWNAELLEELAEAMADASICGLGQAAANPIRSVLRFFPEEVGR